MKKAEGFGRYEKVWISESLWSVAQVTTLWSAIWGKLDPFLRTESRNISNNAAAIHEIRNGEISQRNFYNNMQKKKLFEGNKIRHHRG